jgi:hypothetical protein
MANVRHPIRMQDAGRNRRCVVSAFANVMGEVCGHAFALVPEENRRCGLAPIVAGLATSPLAEAPPCSGSRLALGVRPTLDVLSLVEEPPQPCNQLAPGAEVRAMRSDVENEKDRSGKVRRQIGTYPPQNLDRPG